MHPEDAPRIIEQIKAGLQKQAAVRINGRYLDAEGQFRILQTDARPRFSDTGEFLGMVGVNTDITERIEAERSLAANETRLRRAHTAGRIGDWEIDLETSVMVWSDSQYSLVGLPKTDSPPTRAEFDKRIHPEDLPRVLQLVDESFQSGRFETEFRVMLGDGRYHWLAARGEVHHDHSGKPTRMTGVNFDITSEREAREQQKLLIDELNHRVKNTLALVQSFAHLTLKNSSPEDFRGALMGRVLALAAAHDLLTKRHWSGASIGELMAAELAWLSGSDSTRTSWKGEDVALTPKQTLSLGMVIHELATNAVKHGALSILNGRLSIAWHLGQAQR
jgi:two-component sensor histidine kinase